MATLTLRNIPDSLHEALRASASRHERSLQAEAREILEAALAGPKRLKLGSLLADISRQAARVDTGAPLRTTSRARGEDKPLHASRADARTGAPSTGGRTRRPARPSQTG